MFHVLLINANSLIYKQIDCFSFIFWDSIKAAILV